MTATVEMTTAPTGRTRSWLLLGAAILCEVSASLSLKAGLTAPGFYVITVIGYVSAFVFLALVLRSGMALGVAYGVWAAAGVALTAVASAALFREALTPVMVVGLVLIMAGVVCIELGSHAAAPAPETTPAAAGPKAAE
ncbi:MAG: multidrug efflux SMR transporter [Micrococcus sp.]|nr:multidrug efflux SMR transporter [Micrococcus sp.]